MDHVLTLIAPRGALTHAQVGAVRTALEALGAAVGSAHWLATDEAADLPFAALAPEQAQAAARAALGDAPVDAIAQEAANRRKKLLLADMDGTIVPTETLDELAAEAGVGERVVAITKRSMNGEIDFAAALTERVALLRDLPVGALDAVWARTMLSPGAAAMVATMRAAGARCVLVSGGFTYFTERVAGAAGFDAQHANTLEVADGRLTGRVVPPILDRDAKLAILKREAAALGVALADAVAVGDGANDLAMLGAAGLGVAYRAKPVVAAAARARLDHADLRGVLFAQGFAGADIRAG